VDWFEPFTITEEEIRDIIHYEIDWVFQDGVDKAAQAILKKLRDK
jgi:hypothetical protein